MNTTAGYKPQPAQLQEFQAKVGVLQPIEILWERRSRLWKSTALGFLVGLLIAFLVPKQYESTTRLMPPDSQANSAAAMAAAVMGTMPSLATGLANNLPGLKSPGALFAGILQSRTVQDDLVNRFDLRKVYSCKRYADARKKLASRTAIAEDTKNGIITITVADNDAQRAQGLAVAYVDELNNRVAQLSTSSARRERIFLEDRLKAVKHELDEATLRLSKFSSNNLTFDPTLQGKAMLEAASTLQAQLIAAQTELSGLEQIYGRENARVKAAKARVSELRSKLAVMSGRGDHGQEGNSSLRNGQLYPSLEQLPLLGNTYGDLARRAKIDEAVFEVLTKQYELAKVQEVKEIPTVKVLDAADLPEKTSFPPRLLLGILGACIGFVAAASFAFLQKLWEGLNPADPKRLFVQEVCTSLGWPTQRKSRMAKAAETLPHEKAAL